MQSAVMETDRERNGEDVEIALEAFEVWKTFGSGEAHVAALDSVSIAFEKQHFTAIMGPSGSGKSTLMHCMAGLDSVTSGRIMMDDRELTAMNDKELTILRGERMGFVFQSFNLLPAFTARQNILLPVELAGKKPDKEWLRSLTSTLGIQDRLRHRPSELSGGQQQRVAIARALITRPDVLFCDEPTGSLDSKSGRDVLEFLSRSVDSLNRTVLMVAHDPIAAAYADRVVFLADGCLIGEDRQPIVDSVVHALRGMGE